MSIRIMNLAWGVALPPTQKLLLLALADNADDGGACWPSLRNLAMKCQVSSRTIQRTIKEFEDCGLLEVTTRFAANGRQTSNGYRLTMEGDKLSSPGSVKRRQGDSTSPSPPIGHGAGDISVAPGVTSRCRGEGDTAMAPLEPPQERQCESPLQPRPPLRWPGALTSHQRSLIELMLVPQTHEVAQQLLDELAIALSVPGRIRTTPMRWLAGLLRRHARGEFLPTAEATPAHKADERRAEPAEVCPPPGAPPSERVREQLKAVVERLRVRPD